VFDAGAPSARELARRVLARVERGGAWATLALDAELERSTLDDRDRRLAAELVYGVLRHQTRLDRALSAHADLRRTPAAVVLVLRVAAYQLLFLDRIPAHAAVDDAVNAARLTSGPKVGGFANAVLRKVAAGKEPALPDEPRARLEIEHSMPAWIIDELAAALGDPAQLPAAVAALSQPAPLAIRARAGRNDRDELRAILEAEGAKVEVPAITRAGLVVSGLGQTGASPSFRAGRWTVQDLGAQLVGELAAPAPGARILDACAGVGGKSTHLAELTGDQAHIDAADNGRQKLKLGAATARRLGLASVHPVEADLLDPAAAGLHDRYDLVVLDAPCTGLGVLRRHPEAKWRLVAADVGRMAELQARLLAALAPRVAPGSVLVYSVCTFTEREGPGQIARFLAAHPDFAPEAVADRPAEVRTWPHDHGADAFYMARLRRR
jgi:16S rRNA (cytosine967-C5)-methyltransferase